MKCRDFQEIIDSYLSDELLTETNHDVLRHMESCADCRGVIEARREVRTRLRTAVTNSPQYQIDKNFTHNLRTQLKHEVMQQQTTKTTSWLSFGSWAAAAAGLILVFTFGFFLLNNQGETISDDLAVNDYTTQKVSQNHIVNVAFADHEFCAVEHDSEHPVKFVTTPAKYEKIEKVAMPELKEALTDCSLKESHTCEYEGTKFTHLIVNKGNELLSVMLTDRKEADKFGKDIDFFSSKKYEMARFDVKDTSVFVISGMDKKINTQVAKTLYSPMQKHLAKDKYFQTALLVLK